MPIDLPLDPPLDFVEPATLLAAVVECSDDAVIHETLDGTIASWNLGAQRIFGYAAAEVIGKSLSILIPAQFENEPPILRERLKRGERLVHFETRRRDKYGRIIDVSLTACPIRDRRGVIVGATNLIRFESDRGGYARRLLAAIVESSDDAIISKDLEGVVTSWNRGAEATFGYTAAEMVGRSITLIIPSNRLEEESVILSRIRRGERVEHFETVRQRKDGTLIHVSLTVSPIRDETGRIVGASKIGRDITQRKTNEKIRASLEEKDVLLKEIHHRVKNNLQITSSLLKLQSEYVQDPHALDLFVQSQNRIRSMALVHEKLYRSPDLTGINLLDYAISLAELLSRSFETAERRVAIRVSGEPLQLAVDLAVPCGLILNELVSNAIKHAFVGRESGQVEIQVAREPSLVTLTVADDGVGLPANFSIPNASSLGVQLVETLTRQLHGTLTVRSGPRTEFEVRFAA